MAKKKKVSTGELTTEEIYLLLEGITDCECICNDLDSGEEVMVYRCAGSGLYFPSNYVEMWGRKYGHGLGKAVVSECLETMWHCDCAIPKNLISPDQVMFPLMQGEHQVDSVLLSADEYAALCSDPENWAQCERLDVNMNIRAKILRDKQLNHKNGRLKLIRGMNGVRANSLM